MEMINKIDGNKFKASKSKSMKKNLFIASIEKQLNFDKVKPITLTDSESKDRIEKGDSFNGWYEEELCKFYKTNSTKG